MTQTVKKHANNPVITSSINKPVPSVNDEI